MADQYTAAEIAAAMGVSLRRIQGRAKAERWPHEDRLSGRAYQKLFELSALPIQVQAALRAREVERLREAELQRRAETTSSLDNDGARPPLGAATSSWPARKRDKALQRLALVERSRGLDGDFAAKTTLAREGLDRTYHALQRWRRKADQALAEALQAGRDPLEAQLAAVADGYGGRKGKRIAFEEAAVEYALGLYLKQARLTLKDVHQETLTEARLQNWRVGSYDSLWRVVRDRVPEAALVYAREGKRAYEARCVAKKLRDYRGLPPLFCLVGDHHILDAFVNAPGGNPRRPWLTAWMDLRTRAFVGWTWSFQPNARTIALALRHAILPKENPDLPMHGLPVSVYVDNGKDYRAQGLRGEAISLGRIDYPEEIERFRALGIDPFYVDMAYDPRDGVWKLKRGNRQMVVKDIRIGGMFQRLAIRARFATAYHPWAKPIERAFGEVVRSFSRRLPGWCGSSPEQKPEKLVMELKNPGGRLLTMGQLEAEWENFLAHDYHAQPHSGHGMDGLSPRQVWDSLARPESVDPAVLDFALLEHKQIKVKAWGFRVAELGDEYELWHEDQAELAALLNRLSGQKVDVLYDSGHPEVCRVLHQGRFACWARTLRRGSWISEEGMAEHARLQGLQRRQIGANLAALGADPTAAPPSRTQEHLKLIADAEVGLGLELKEIVAEAPALPEPEAEIPPEDRDKRPELFEDGLTRSRWIARQLGLGRETSPADRGFYADFRQTNPTLVEALDDREEYFRQLGEGR